MDSSNKYDYHLIPDYYISLSNETQNLITNLKLQKLMYYTQAWHLAITDSRLFNGVFQAWVHGPVMVELYNEYRNFKWNPIERKDLGHGSLDRLRNRIDEQTLEFIDQIVDEYFGMSAYELERLTHMEEPWRKARVGLSDDQPSNEIIKDEWMIEYIKKYLKDEDEEKNLQTSP